jgi:hypothetical protein
MRIRIAAAMGLLLAACSEPPTGTSAAPPSFDTGYVIGSGNRNDQDTLPPQGRYASDPAHTNETAANADSAAADNGYVIGSGN